MSSNVRASPLSTAALHRENIQENVTLWTNSYLDVTGFPAVREAALKQLRQTVKSNPGGIGAECVARTLVSRLASDSTKQCVVTLECIDRFFVRSLLFRRAIVDSLRVIIEMTLLQPSVGKPVKDHVVNLIEQWNAQFASRIPRLALAYAHMKREARQVLPPGEREGVTRHIERVERVRKDAEKKLQKLRVEIEGAHDSFSVLFDRLERAFRVLVPDVRESHTDTTRDSQRQPRAHKAGGGMHLKKESNKEHGMLSSEYSIEVHLRPADIGAQIAVNQRTQIAFRVVHDVYPRIKCAVSPVIQQWRTAVQDITETKAHESAAAIGATVEGLHDRCTRALENCEAILASEFGLLQAANLTVSEEELNRQRQHEDGTPSGDGEHAHAEGHDEVASVCDEWSRRIDAVLDQSMEAGDDDVIGQLLRDSGHSLFDDIQHTEQNAASPLSSFLLLSESDDDDAGDALQDVVSVARKRARESHGDGANDGPEAKVQKISE